MDIRKLMQSLMTIVEPAGTVMTLTLDLAKSGILPPATRVFLKDQVLRGAHWSARPVEVQDALRKIARKVEEYVTKGVKPETDGLYLVAGRGAWEAVELRVPMRNFVTLGRTPYVAPLAEALTRAPRALEIAFREGGASIGEWLLGGRRELGAIAAEEFEADVQHVDASRRVKVRAGPTTLGGKGSSSARDRYQQVMGESAKGVLRRLATRLSELNREGAVARIFAAGTAEQISGLRKALPAELGRILEKAPADAGRRLEQLAAERAMAEIGEFNERWKQETLVALGPKEVLEQLGTGRLARVFVNPDEPVAGMVCPECGARYPGLQRKCVTCPARLEPASLVQELMVHAAKHPPLAMTFVPGPERAWVADLGGMAALLSAKGMRRSRKP
jgi:hypothetical protein